MRRLWAMSLPVESRSLPAQFLEIPARCHVSQITNKSDYVWKVCYQINRCYYFITSRSISKELYKKLLIRDLIDDYEWGTSICELEVHNLLPATKKVFRSRESHKCNKQ